MLRTMMVCVAAMMLWATGAVAGVAERTESWTTLDVPAEHASMGRVYYVKYPPHSAQITFKSDAPLERIVGTSGAVVGYMVAEMAGDQPTGRILAGAFRVPVRSFDTGIPMRNDHVRGAFFLNAEEHPDILVSIRGSEGVSETKKDEKSASYDVTLNGELTLRGVAKEGQVPARVTFLKGSQETKAAGSGDVLAMRCSYSVKRSDYNIATRFPAAELADEMTIDQFLILTTVSAEQESIDKGGDPMGLKFTVLYRDYDNPQESYVLAEEFLEKKNDDAKALSVFVFDVAMTDASDERCQALAMQAATRAVELTESKDADTLGLVAFLYSQRSEMDKAVEWQKKAVEHKDSSSDPGKVEMVLKRYQAMAASSK